jgi:hypothetical protein
MEANKKYVIWTDSNGKIETAINVTNIERSESWNKKEISIWRLLVALIFEKGFKWKLQETIIYAIVHHNAYRGDGSSNVMLFENTKNFWKIWKNIKK